MSTAELIALEPQLRLWGFLGVLMLLGLGEYWLVPSRVQWQRVLSNVGLVVISGLLLRATLPMLAVGFAAWVEARHIGLLEWLTWPSWIEVLLAVLVMDLVIYLQHRWFHAANMLWRVHRVHHSDQDFDVSLALRFHPIELALSMLIKFSAIAALGAAPLAVLVFEVMLSIGALWTHTRIELPDAINRWLSLAFVTPNMHRIHHSDINENLQSNFGTVLSIWDRLFASFRAEAVGCPTAIRFGLIDLRADSLWDLLRLPFRKL